MIKEWLNKEQEIKLNLEMGKIYKNRFNHKRKLQREIARQDLEFVKMRNAGVKGLHPKMLEKTSNII